MPWWKREAVPTLALALLVLILCLATDAFGHGEYAWIAEGGYTNEKNQGCCGEQDCFKLEPGDFYLEGDRWIIDLQGVEYWYPAEHTRPSEDGHAWVCINMDYEHPDDEAWEEWQPQTPYDTGPPSVMTMPKVGDKARCFFVGVGG